MVSQSGESYWGPYEAGKDRVMRQFAKNVVKFLKAEDGRPAVRRLVVVPVGRMAAVPPGYLNDGTCSPTRIVDLLLLVDTSKHPVKCSADHFARSILQCAATSPSHGTPESLYAG